MAKLLNHYSSLSLGFVKFVVPKIGFYRGGLNYWGSPEPKKIKTKNINSINQDIIFAFWMNMGPFLISKKDFYLYGKFDELYSNVGECGIGFDSAFSTIYVIYCGKIII